MGYFNFDVNSKYTFWFLKVNCLYSQEKYGFSSPLKCVVIALKFENDIQFETIVLLK